MLTNDIFLEARALIDAEQAVDASRHSSNNASNDGAHRASDRVPAIRAILRAADHALGVSPERRQEGQYRDVRALTHTAVGIDIHKASIS